MQRIQRIQRIHRHTTHTTYTYLPRAMAAGPSRPSHPSRRRRLGRVNLGRTSSMADCWCYFLLLLDLHPSPPCVCAACLPASVVVWARIE
jgi:hypothetical protein